MNAVVLLACLLHVSENPQVREHGHLHTRFLWVSSTLEEKAEMVSSLHLTTSFFSYNIDINIPPLVEQRPLIINFVK